MSTIFNCKSAGNIQSNTHSIGGIIGNADYTKIEYCINEATIESNSFNIGGIIGNSSASSLKKCGNLGEIIGSSNVSGIMGQAYNSAVEECYNMGNISGNTYVSGIIGSLQGTTVNNCYNQGNITANYSTSGGIIGSAAKGSITNCYNTGISEFGIIGIVKDDVQGMIVLNNCYYLNDSTTIGENIIEGCEDFISGTSIGKGIENMIGNEFVGLLNNNSNVWKQKQNSFPILSWQENI